MPCLEPVLTIAPGVPWSFINEEVQRLRDIARPREDALRAQVRSRLFNAGRLGLGTGGGLTPGTFQPELAALEEGLARADTGRVQAARQEQQRGLLNLLDIIQAQQSLSTLPLQASQLGVAAGAPAGATAGLLNAGNLNARGIEGFFGSLARRIPTFFDDDLTGGGQGQPIPITGPGLL